MLKKLKKLFGGGLSIPSQNGFFLKVRCKECEETFNLFINTSTDLMQDFDESGNVAYSLNKEIIGSRCRNLIHVHLTFDGSKRMLSKKIEKGEFIEEPGA